MKSIRLTGARQNNLKGVNLEIPLGSFTVVCGPSGSGKSSLAFETLYAEGQRRYVESLSNYSRQFLNKAPKPDLENIENVPPAIAIEQKNSVKSSRSTVGTTTELIDYLRLLFEKAGKAYCPQHHLSLEKYSPSTGTEKILQHFSGERGYILCPIYPENRLLEGKKLLASLIQDGFLRIYVPSKKKAAKASAKKVAKKSTKKVLQEAKTSEAVASTILPYSEGLSGEIIELDSAEIRKKGAPKEEFFIVIDRMVFQDTDRGRMTDSLSQAFSASIKYNKALTAAKIFAQTVDGRALLLTEENACTVCGFSFPPITAALFSFNSPVGACPTCNGFGNELRVDEAKIVPNPNLSLNEGCLSPFAMPSAAYDRRELKKFCEKNDIDLNKPWKSLPPKHRKLIWEGNKSFYGVVGLFEYLETKKYKMHVRVFISRFKSAFVCSSCKGSRLRPEAQQVLLNGKSISDLSALTIENLAQFMAKLDLPEHIQQVCKEPLSQVRQRLGFLMDVGVGYLSVDRATRTLSGGEFQRLNLANQLGMGLSQTLYVLDEPTIGLHPRDNHRLIQILKNLRDLGNTLVVVEHDYDVIKSSSHVIEMGPGSGQHGGEVIFTGTQKEFFESTVSNTLPYLVPSSNWQPPRTPRPVDINKYKFVLEMAGCSGHNLKDVDVQIPLNRLVTVTGVSGSGKSTLIGQTLYPAIARHLDLEYIQGEAYEDIQGLQHVKNLIFIDQSRIGKTARSSPVTYLKIFDAIRAIMASSSEARSRGYTPGTFSLNVDGGRCPVCKGLGYEMVDMMFMDDIEIKCDACEGKRYRPEVLEIEYKQKNLAEILNMTVSEAMDFFVQYPNIRRPLSLLKEVGLEYVRLGQSANSLSGGESQRLKVARELTVPEQRGTLYILDEPTTGLHFREVHLLLKVLNKLVDAGASVLLIEHNLEIIRNSDYLIDMGPEAGERGGKLVAVGTPDDIMASKKSLTGHYLKEYIESLTPKANTFARPGPTEKDARPQ